VAKEMRSQTDRKEHDLAIRNRILARKMDLPKMNFYTRHALRFVRVVIESP